MLIIHVFIEQMSNFEDDLVCNLRIHDRIITQITTRATLA